MFQEKTQRAETVRSIVNMMREGDTVNARAILLKWLSEESDNHWVLVSLANTFHEDRDYQEALVYQERALRIAPNCPLVLWNYAGTLDMLNREEEAIDVWKKLVRRGVRSIAYGDCGEGIREARSLVNDAHYRIGLAYADLGKTDLAKKHLRKHIANRDRNTPSTYHLREVRRKLAKIEAGENPRPQQD